MNLTGFTRVNIIRVKSWTTLNFSRLRKPFITSPLIIFSHVHTYVNFRQRLKSTLSHGQSDVHTVITTVELIFSMSFFSDLFCFFSFSFLSFFNFI